ncbi:MAG: HAMP domain-containing sensor histidine kinase [Micrococcaceae bacterium]
MKITNLRNRILVALLIALFLGLLITNVVTIFGTKRYVHDKTDKQLQVVTKSYERVLISTSTNNQNLTSVLVEQASPEIPPIIEPRAARINPDYKVIAQTKPTIDSSFDFSQISKETLRAGAVSAHYFNIKSVHNDDQKFRGVVFPLQNTKDLGVVLLPTGNDEDTVYRVMSLSIFTSLTILSLAMLMTWRVVTKRLKPLDDIADVAENIAEGNTSERIEVTGDEEIARLSDSINMAFESQEAVEKRLRNFIADASHELRTPLTSIRGYAELIQTGVMDTPEKLNKAATRIEKEAARLSGIVQDLLNTVRIEDFNNLTQTSVNVVPIIHDAISDAYVVNPKQRITYQGPKKKAKIHADEGAIRQILLNLLTNARVHNTPDTEVIISLEKIHKYLKLSVRDFGKGMTKEQREKAFRRFWREDRRIGSGLGLTIVSRFTKAHGGHVEAVAPESGPGTQINVYLPDN